MGYYRFETIAVVEVDAETIADAETKLGALPAMMIMSTQTMQPVREARIVDEDWQLVETPDGWV